LKENDDTLLVMIQRKIKEGANPESDRGMEKNIIVFVGGIGGKRTPHTICCGGGPGFVIRATLLVNHYQMGYPPN